MPASQANPAKDSGRGWPVVFAGFVGLLISFGTLMIYSFGVLSAAMGAEYEWGAIQRGTLFTSASLAATIGGPVWGAVADRWGGRNAAIASSSLLAIGFLALPVLPGNIYVMYGVFALLGLAGAGTMPPTYASVVVGWFDRRRGLALGAMMTSVGVGAAVLPPLAATLTVQWGWRGAYSAFGAAIAVLVVPICLLLLREHPDARPTATRTVDRSTLVRAGLRERKTWILLAFALLTGAALVQSVSSFIAVLQSRGLSLVEAATYQSILGVSLIAGRVVIGGLIDRVFAPFVMVGVLLVTAAAFFVFVSAASPVAYALAAMGIGLAIGAEVDFLGFMVSRYYDSATFATIFAFLFTAYALGGSVAPLLYGWLAHSSGSYAAGITLSGVLMLLVAALMLALPRYEEPGRAP